MADRHPSGVLDTCAYIDLDLLDPADLPAVPELTAITMAELQQGVVMAKDAGARAARMEKLGAAVADFDPLPFDGEAAARYGTLVTLTIAARRDPPPPEDGSHDRRHRLRPRTPPVHPQRRRLQGVGRLGDRRRHLTRTASPVHATSAPGLAVRLGHQRSSSAARYRCVDAGSFLRPAASAPGHP